MRATDSGSVATDHTIAFCNRVWQEPSRILEIGCGRGELAAALRARGHDVTALDPNEDSVNAARERGVSAHVSPWPSPAFAREHGDFDGVLYCRSLHHMEDLEGALAGTEAVLRAGGTVVAEDFAFDEASPAARRWLMDVMHSFHVAGALQPESQSFAAAVVAHEFDPRVWHSEHLPGHADGHPLVPASKMQEALARRFHLEAMERSPYLFRYLIGALPDSVRERALKAVLELERVAIEQDAEFAVGRRWVGRKK